MAQVDLDPSLKAALNLDGVTPRKGPSLDSDIHSFDPLNVRISHVGTDVGGFRKVEGDIEGKGPVTFYIATPAVQSDKKG